MAFNFFSRLDIKSQYTKPHSPNLLYLIVALFYNNITSSSVIIIINYIIQTFPSFTAIKFGIYYI